MHQEVESVMAFTPYQLDVLRKTIHGMMAEYWAEDGLKRTIREAATERVESLFDHNVKAQVLTLLEGDKGKEVFNELFRQGGMVVRTKSSEFLDQVVAGLLTDPATGVPELIRSYVRANLHQLTLQAVTAVVTQMVIDYIKGNSDGLANASKGLIEAAFQNARFRQPGY